MEIHIVYLIIAVLAILALLVYIYFCCKKGKCSQSNTNLDPIVIDYDAYNNGTIVSNLTAEDLQFLLDDLNLEPHHVKKCHCDDDDMVLFPMPLAELNPSIGRLRRRGAAPNGQSNFTIDLLNTAKPLDNKQRAVAVELPAIFSSILPPPSSQNPKNLPVVAILDSGLDTSQLNKAIQLMDTTAFNATLCSNLNPQIPSHGWNFADDNSNVNDTSWFHGTDVTNTFLQTLYPDQAPNPPQFQLLTLKVFGESGFGSYWNIICAFKYLNRLKQAGYTIPIINTSFSFEYDITQESLDNLTNLKKYIDSLTDSVIVSSAGNRKKDLSDNVKTFPACFNETNNIPNPNANNKFLPKSENVVAVAGHNGKYPSEGAPVSPEKLETANFSDPTKAFGSNYGDATADIAAKWKSLVLGKDGAEIKTFNLEGTSFSAPQIAAKLFSHYQASSGQLSNGADLLSNFLNSNQVKNNATKLKVLGNKYID